MRIVSIESNFICGFKLMRHSAQFILSGPSVTGRALDTMSGKMEEVFMLMTSKTASEQFLVLEDDRGHTADPRILYFLQELIHCVVSEIWLTLK